MNQTLRMQDPGEGIHEAEVVDVLVERGDHVEVGQEVMRIETDKAVFGVESPFSGVVDEVAVGVGDVIHVGEPLMRLHTDGTAQTSDRPKADADTQPQTHAESDAGTQAEPESGAPPEAESGSKPESGSQAPSEPEPDRTQASRRDSGAARSRSPVAATPATRHLAHELGVDLRTLQPSGSDGRVLRTDVQAAARASGGRGTARTRDNGLREAAKQPGSLPDFERFGAVERRPLRSVRRTTARRMAQASARVAQATHFDDADIGELEALRRRLAPAVKAAGGGTLTLGVLVAKATAACLREFPRFNTSFDAEREELVFKHYCNLGFAVDTERGLLVPVVREPQRMSLGELAATMGELAQRARAGEARLEELSGGTFTLTNVGSIGGTGFTPIVNHPEVAILGMGRSRLEPTARGSLEDPEVVVSLRLPLALSFDHRAIDGAEAARFVNRLIDLLSNPDRFLAAV